MTLLCAAGVTIIGAALVLVSLFISESRLTERGQALFESASNTIAFRLGAETILDWSWLSGTEADAGIVAHIEDNGEPLLFSSRDVERKTLARAAQEIALAQYGTDAKKRPTSALNNNRADFRMKHGENEYRACVIVMRTQTGYKSLTVLGDVALEKKEILNQRLFYAGLLAAGVLAMSMFSWWFAGQAVKPVAKSQKQQAEFVAAASHELRTPLAVIRTNASALLKKNGEEPFAATIERECARTGKLVDDLLVLSGADAGAWRMDVAPVELEHVLKETAEAFRAAADAKDQRLEVKLPPAMPIIAGDELRLRQLCSILLDNACHYTPVDGSITVSASSKGRFTQFSVADNGPGIPAEERERVFGRFYRLDKARSQKEHYGLGLPIAKEIAASHRGDIRLSETEGGGLTVTVRLPAAGR